MEKNTGGGISFCGMLTLIFITLKLLEVIAWSWWWVLSPIWIPTAIALATILLIVIWAIVK